MFLMFGLGLHFPWEIRVLRFSYLCTRPVPCLYFEAVLEGRKCKSQTLAATVEAYNQVAAQTESRSCRRSYLRIRFLPAARSFRPVEVSKLDRLNFRFADSSPVDNFAAENCSESLESDFPEIDFPGADSPESPPTDPIGLGARLESIAPNPSYCPPPVLPVDPTFRERL